jgi:hypothetical protein
MKIQDILVSENLDEAMDEFMEVGGFAIWCFVADLTAAAQQCELGDELSEEQRLLILCFLRSMLLQGPDHKEFQSFAFTATHKALKMKAGKLDYREILLPLIPTPGPPDA